MPMSPRLLRPKTAASTAFDLRTITGLGLWLNAADAASFTFGAGDAVAQWNDSSGNGRHAGQTVAANRPTRSGTHNGLPTVAFAGTPNQWLNFTWTNFAQQPATYFFVSRINASAVQWLLGGASTHIIIGAGSSASVVEVSRAGVASHVSAARQNAIQLITYRQTGGSATLTVGSTLASTSSAFSYVANSAWTLGRATLGGGFDGFLNGQIAEVAIYDRVLSASEFSAVAAALSAKWGVAGP